ncbi:MAG: recombinase family protein [Anaerolineales bacterium]|jgi:DNA invertase Pin-like site-specific DNA recombinase/DNA-directed RNA polymerase subunit M/transcription elongation factor TFIIS
MPDYIYPPSALIPGSRVWAYLRDSGGDAQEQSVPQQESEIREYCDRYELNLVHVFRDIAKSGGSAAGREAFNDMIDMSSDNELLPSGLLIWNFARFARDLDDANYFKALLRRRGLVIHSLTDPIPEGQYGRLIESMIDFTNEEKRRQNSRDVKRALAALTRQGYSSGGCPPRGYISEHTEIGKKRDGKPRIVSKWVPDPELKDLVILAWQLRAEGRSYSDILKVTKGKLYRSHNCLVTFFKNKTYLGIGKCGELEVANHHEPLISQELWHAVQNVRESAPRHGESGKPAHPRRIAYPSLLSGMAFCIKCGAAMIYHKGHRNRVWRFYICGKKDRQRNFEPCTNRRINAQKAENAILNAVLYRILTPSFVEELIEETQKELEDINGIDQKISDLQLELRETGRAIQNLLDLTESFGVGAAVERLRQREVDRIRLIREIDQLKANRKLSEVQITPETIAIALDSWRGQLEGAQRADDIRALKGLMTYFVSKVELGYKQAKVWYSFPINQNPPINVFSLGGTTIYGC